SSDQRPEPRVLIVAHLQPDRREHDTSPLKQATIAPVPKDRELSGCRWTAETPPAIVRGVGISRPGGMAEGSRGIVVFDLGGVLIDWDPRHLYRKLFAGDAPAMEQFLATVCTDDWNRSQDAGRSFAEGARQLNRQHPDKAE